MSTLKVPIGRPTVDVITVAYRAGVPVLLVGPHGVGKSDMFRQAARELSIEFVDRDLSLLEPPDLVGMPEVRDGRTTFVPPSFLPTEAVSPKGLLVLEELNRCPAYMKAPCLQLLTARRLNDYILPPGWLPCASVNPFGDEYDTNELDPALLSRFVVTFVTANHREWLKWAVKEALHPTVVAYVRAHADVFSHRDSNPRAWNYVSRVMYAADEIPASRRAVRTCVAGIIGHNRAAAFFAFAEHEEGPLTANEVLKHFDGYVPMLRNWISAGRMDLIEHTVMNVLAHLQAKANVERARTDPQVWTNLANFIKEIPGDLRERAIRHLKEHGHAIPDFPESTNEI